MRWVVLLATLMVACDEEDDPAAPHLPPVCAPSDATCDPYDQVHVLGTWGQALCRFLLECCAADDRLGTLELLVGEENAELLLLTEPRLLSDDESCRSAMNQALVLSMEEDWLAVAAGRRAYLPDAGRSCLEGVVTGSEACVPGLVLVAEPYLPPSCNEMIIPAMERDGACYDSGDCLPGADGELSTCFNASGLDPAGAVVSLAGTCEPLPQQGEPCALPDGECEVGTFCSPLTATCAARAAVGQSCTGQLCIEGSFCNPQTVRCTALQSTGAPCATDDQCLSGSCSAEPHVCLPPAALDPMITEYTFCLGDGDYGRLTDYLPGDGRAGGD